MRLGSDPEVFLQDNGTLRSAIGFINANKWSPLQVPDMAKGFTLQEDNVALEYGIPPASSREEFIAHISAVMEKSLEYVDGLSFSKLSAAIFPESEMQDPLAHIFGCEPDRNAWTGRINPKPKPPHKFMRSAGGHIHIETKRNKRDVIKAMDLFLGVPSVLMDAGEDRRKLYGSAGAYRAKPYGVEYRTLSNFWIFEDRLKGWVWDNTERAVAWEDSLDERGEQIQHCINNNDKALAAALVDIFNLEVV